MNEFKVRNHVGKLIAAFDSFEMASRYLKHHQQDGDYSVIGPEYDCTLERRNGVLYPTSGVFDGERMPPRSVEEAKEVFGFGDFNKD